MAVEVIEGTLEATEPTRGKRGYGQYVALRIDGANGQERTISKVAAGPAMVEEIRQGGAGRYYLARADGANALIGVRRPDGAAIYAHYQNIEPIVLIAGLFGAAAAVARFGFGADMFLIPALLGPLLLVGWFYLRSQRLAQRGFFEADRS